MSDSALAAAGLSGPGATIDCIGGIMKRRSLFLAPAGLAMMAAAGLFATPAEAGGKVNALIGQKEQDRSFSDRDNIQEQDMLGLMLDCGAEGWPVNFALDVVNSSKDVNDNDFNITV